MPNDETPDLNKIHSDLRRWYYSEIRSLADSAIEACNEYFQDTPEADEDERRERMDEWCQETIDGHEFVIYTFKAKCALLASDSEDAMEDELGESGTVEQRCYFAMRADVRDVTEARSDEWGQPTNANEEQSE